MDVDDLQGIRRMLEAATRRFLPSRMASHREDIVQLALVKVHAAASEGRTVNRTWLKRVAYTTMIDEMRKLRLEREVSMEPEDDAPAEQLSPERESASRQLGVALRACLALLPEHWSAALVMFISGHRAREIGERLAISTKQSENLVFRARDRTRTCLAGKGFDKGSWGE